jgi:hypothetical protein
MNMAKIFRTTVCSISSKHVSLLITWKSLPIIKVEDEVVEGDVLRDESSGQLTGRLSWLGQDAYRSVLRF